MKCSAGQWVLRSLAADPCAAQHSGAQVVFAAGRTVAAVSVTDFGKGLKPPSFRGNLQLSVVMAGISRQRSSAASRPPMEAISCFQTTGTPNSLRVDPTASADCPPSTPAGLPAGVSFLENRSAPMRRFQPGDNSGCAPRPSASEHHPWYLIYVAVFPAQECAPGPFERSRCHTRRCSPCCGAVRASAGRRDRWRVLCAHQW